ncbi:MAG: threonine/serine exporter family protein [Clostridia bacterium]
MSAPWRMKALCLAGRIILENGGETYRAEDTVVHMAHSLGLCETDVFGVPSGLFISFTDEQGERQTSVCRVYPRDTNLSRVDAVNQLSRKLAAGELAQEALVAELQAAEQLGENLPEWRASVVAALSVMGFTPMFGGGPVDMAVGAVCAALTQLAPKMLKRLGGGGIPVALVGSVACTLIPLWFHQVTGLGLPDVMIAGALMPLVPGLSMTNAVQDLLRGDMISGVAHGARAVLTAALVAGGALIGTHLFRLLGGGV